ncbi:Histone-lysine N-methyltransferase SUVR5 [Apostasia shenzhenica]|uniref:Histone-lysine N-methyltransferase SUVR5 n=1 Tax=Apostasia shenzhenica TaxID=1088818 RepID=A0A2I0A235_9ASPA|nr:Histone-lysine N-methyltransferase SUVR5 [Apostasia shenzhenica]
MESVLWSKVDELWNAPVQPELRPKWKTWKQEAMDCFLISNSPSSFKRVEQNNSDIFEDGEAKACRKRLKLDVNPLENSVSHIEVSDHLLSSPTKSRIIDSELNSNSQGLTELASYCQAHKMVALPRVGVPTGSSSLDDRLKDRTQEGEDTDLTHNKVQSSKEPILLASDLSIMSQKYLPDLSSISKKYRQCLAFVETKGRQCGRWANEGDIYCCVHLNNHLVRKDAQFFNCTPLVEAPMCQGTTTHGNKCKHRARYGSSFCKKHLFQGSQSSRTADFLLMSSTDLPKRKQQEDEVLESISNTNASNDHDETSMREAANSTQENPILISEKMDERRCIMKQSELHNAFPTSFNDINSNFPRCIGHCSQRNVGDCQEFARWHTLYCEKHIPKFLKRARNGKSRIISKDVFNGLLKSCSSRKEKLYLHQACELLYRFLKTGLSRQKFVSSGEHVACIIAEASKDLNVGEYLLKLVSCERAKIMRLWDLNNSNDQRTSSTEINYVSTMNQDLEMPLKCNICAQEFSVDHMLCRHWIEVHKKEVRQFFRGYACIICMGLFANHKVLETHVIANHGVQVLERAVSLRCMSCGSLFVNHEELWQHVCSSHSTELLNLNQCSSTMQEDKGVHFLLTRRDNFLKRDSVSHSRFWKNFGSPSTFNKHSSPDALKDVQGSFSLSLVNQKLHSPPSVITEFGRLSQSDCSVVAEALFTKLKKTKVRPNNLEILSVARSSCCRISLEDALGVKYGTLPGNIYLKAAKLCSELNMQVSWHQEGFVCPRGCSRHTKSSSLSPLVPLPSMSSERPIIDTGNDVNKKMVESHYILNPEQFNMESWRKSIVICNDISFGKEATPVACVVDDEFKYLLNNVSSSQEPSLPMPWQGFTYITERLVDPSLGLNTKITQLRCACPHPTCYPENCDHVYLFDNDYDTAVDIHGIPMHGRFPYDDQGRIVLKEGYLVYECNSMCSCDITCKNRVLQKGIQVKLEIFRTEKKGWAVRAGQAISRGTFVCEYTGEVVVDAEADKRNERYGSSGCSYIYDIDMHIDRMRCFSEEPVLCVIDANKYGNVSRFINHSCAPNLVSYLVLVDSMDCQLAHVGLFADRDIAFGEELAYDYRCKLLRGDGLICHCGAPNCRGRLC